MIRKFALSTFSALALVASGLLAPSANAALVDITWTGSFIDGTDNLGLFGDVGASLADRNYVATYRFDTSIGYTNDGFTAAVHGGSNVIGSLTTPAISASISVEGGPALSANLGRDDTYQHVNNPPGFSLISTEVMANSGTVDILFNRVSRGDAFFPLSLDVLFARIFGVAETANGYFQRFGAGGLATSGNLRPTSIDIALVDTQVPLPAAWPLMLSGVGLVGFMASRRKRRKVDQE